MLKHNVIAWIGDEPAGAQLVGIRPIISLSPVAGVAGVEEIGIRSTQLRRQGPGAVVIDAEIVLSLDSIRKTAINALKAKFDPQNRLERGDSIRGECSSVSSFRINERIQ
jgi:hypothetical protein